MVFAPGAMDVAMARRVWRSAHRARSVMPGSASPVPAVVTEAGFARRGTPTRPAARAEVRATSAPRLRRAAAGRKWGSVAAPPPRAKRRVRTAANSPMAAASCWSAGRVVVQPRSASITCAPPAPVTLSVAMTQSAVTAPASAASAAAARIVMIRALHTASSMSARARAMGTSRALAARFAAPAAAPISRPTRPIAVHVARPVPQTPSAWRARALPAPLPAGQRITFAIVPRCRRRCQVAAPWWPAQGFTPARFP
jgi:hypothetical protein